MDLGVLLFKKLDLRVLFSKSWILYHRLGPTFTEKVFSSNRTKRFCYNKRKAQSACLYNSNMINLRVLILIGDFKSFILHFLFVLFYQLHKYGS